MRALIKPSAITLPGCLAAIVLFIVAGARARGIEESSTGVTLDVRGSTQNLDRAAAAGATDSWWASVMRDLEQREYNLSPSRDGLQAPNRAHGLRIYFEDDRIEVVPRQVSRNEAPWRFAWRTVAWGREDNLQPVGLASLRTEGARAEYMYGSGLVEWYENRPEGIEQGFRISEQPAGSGWVLVAGSFPEGIRAELATDGTYIDLLNEDDVRLLRYGGLHVNDANGRTLSSHLSLSDATIRVLFDDTGATYPIEIDPLLTSPSWMVESNQSGAFYGHAVSLAGDVNGDGYGDAIVGAWSYDSGVANVGAAFIYNGSPTGLGTTSAWMAEGEQGDSRFGEALSTAGDVNGDGYADVIIGASRYQNGETEEGKVYVFHGSSTGLATEAAWEVESDYARAYYGYSVSSAGDVDGDGYDDVVIGALGYDAIPDSLLQNGRAYVYLGSAVGLGQEAHWSVLGEEEHDRFGTSVSTAGDVNGDGYADVIIGAVQQAFVFHGSASGLASEFTWFGEADSTDQGYGCTVSLAGDVNGDGYGDVIVGTWDYTYGSAYVYHGSASGLTATAVWMGVADQEDEYFGTSVSQAGDVNGDGYSDVIVGAHRYDGGDVDEGRALVYYGSSAGLSSTAAWAVESDVAHANFGGAVSGAGDVNGDGYGDVIVGAPRYENGEGLEGAAYVYHGSAAGLTSAAAWFVDSQHNYADLGCSVSGAGDVNGDGYGDVIVGARFFDDGETQEGHAFAYHGGPSGLDTSPGWVGEGDQRYAYYGSSVSSAGDVNGDGYGDVIVGARGYDNGETDEGAAFVYHGSASGLAAGAAWTAEGDQADAKFGWSVSEAGDVNGDGYGDVIVGARNYTNLYAGEGRDFVYHGSPSGLESSPAWTVDGNQVDAALGEEVATAGDVNGDGYSDVILGNRFYDDAYTSDGRAYVYHGSALGLASTPAWTATGAHQSAGFGSAVGTAGDVNGDGYADVIVGADGHSNGESHEGRAYVFHGSASGLASSPAWFQEANQASANYGCTVSTAGDVNGDGYSDVIVGADDFDNGQTNEGQAYVYCGSDSGLASTAVWTAEGDEEEAAFGQSVAAAGDVNGDGYGDVIVGAPDFDPTNDGRAFVYLGNESGPTGGNVTLLPRQLRAAGGPIALLGVSDEYNSFRLAAWGRTPAGRARVRLEWSAEELGTSLGGTAIHTSDWYDTGPVGTSGSVVQLDELVTGLMPETPYHWRLRIASDSPYFPHTHWLTISPSVPSLTQLRTGEGGVAVELAEEAGGSAVRLYPVKPNPIGPVATIRFELPAAGDVRLAVYDVAGRLVKMLTDDHYEAGSHYAVWRGVSASGRRVSPGVYFARLQTKDHEASRKMILVK